MAGPLNTLSMSPEQILLQQIQRTNEQIGQLQQPVQQQGGFLSGVDPVMLSLASGLLSPTKTGAFGESIGLGLQAVQSPLAEARRQEAARADKLAALQNAQAKLAMDLYEVQTGGKNKDSPRALAATYNNSAANLERNAAITMDDAKKAEMLSLASEYRKRANAILGISVPEPKVEPTPEKKDEGDFGKKVKEIGTSALEWVTGRDYGGKKTSEQPEAGVTEDTSEQPETGVTDEGLPAEEETVPADNPFYTGDKPPKDQPGAIKAPDGKWYVVKEGKHYPVLNK